MKRSILMAVAGFGLSVLVTGSGSAFAGENNFPAWESWGPVETGTVPSSDAVKLSADKIPAQTRDMETGVSEFDANPELWEESGG